MRRLTLHLMVALLAFTVGITTAYAYGLFFGAAEPRAGAGFTSWEAPPAPPRKSGCRGSVREFTPPQPPTVMVMPSAPEPPPAPAAPSRPTPKQTRIVIRGADGSVKVIKSEGEVRAVETQDGRATKF